VKICGRNALFSQWCRGGNWVCDKDVLELPVEFYNLKNATIYMKSKFQKILQRKEKEKYRMVKNLILKLIPSECSFHGFQFSIIEVFICQEMSKLHSFAVYLLRLEYACVSYQLTFGNCCTQTRKNLAPDLIPMECLL
jgi:hypothetical protein